MRKIQILMSVYNGEKYLETQIKSILSQDCERKNIAKVTLLIRDDGSSDNTHEILNKYSKLYPDSIRWYKGENIGVINSFFDLVEHSDEVDYYAFSDQDDYWLPDKLSEGVKKVVKREDMTTSEEPILYGCRPKLVDVNLNEIKSGIKIPVVQTGFGNALIENVITGCTAIINNKLKKIIMNYLPKYTVMHDWWFYIVATYCGHVIYDENSYILYRQHGNNVLGSATKYGSELRKRIFSWKKDCTKASRQAKAFMDVLEFNKLKTQKNNFELLKEFVNGKSSIKLRFKLALNKNLYRQRKIDNIMFKILILFNIY